MKNKEIAKIFSDIAEFLSLENENPFRIRAYEKASQIIESLPQDIEEISKTGNLRKISGIGEGMTEKINEYLSTCKIIYYEELKKKFPQSLLEIMSIPGMGPKKAKLIFDKLGIFDIQQLKEAAKRQKLRNLPGFGEKTERNILGGIKLKEESKGRILLSEALNISEKIIGLLKQYKEIEQISSAGSLRRKKETIGDIDILCIVKRGKENFVIEKFTQLTFVKNVLSKGKTKASIISEGNIQVDLRVLKPESYGAALLYFTGSKQHNISLRELANKKSLTINEYGIFDLKDKTKPLAGKNEQEIYTLLNLQYIPPELREDCGEIEIAAKNNLPDLVKQEDIKGDTHIHSTYSDGTNTITEFVQKIEQLGLEWIIIADHSQSLKIARGISIKDLYKKIDEIRSLNKKSKIKILCGSEVDILSDGSLDYPDEVLKEIDFVICAIHTGFKQSEQQITERIKKAFENKYVHTLSHPSGRLLTKRPSYSVNMDKVLDYAKQQNICLEINAYPIRLDLDNIYCKKAKQMNIKMTIGTDSHNITHMEYLKLGVYVAQRGWLEKKDVINTLSCSDLLKFLKFRR